MSQLGEAVGTPLMLAVDGEALSQREDDLFRRVQPSGVTLFKRNLSSDPEQIIALTKALQATRAKGAPPLIIAIDQEGGRVARLKAPFPDEGPAMNLAKGTSQSALLEIEAYGERVGEALLLLGINVNFAPVVDILTHPDNHAIGDRAFGCSQEEVSCRAGAYLRGLQKSGVWGCLKHFPGQGDAHGDTHEKGVVISWSKPQLMAREVEPFRELLPEAKLVMVSHCVYPAFSDRPASLAKEVVGDLLIGELGFQGLVVSDDMNMKALPQGLGEWQEALLEAFLAGNHLLLVCQGFERCETAYQVMSRARAQLGEQAFGQRVAAIHAFRRTLSLNRL